MDEISVRLDEETDIDAFTFGGVDEVKNQNCQRPGRGEDQWLFEKIKVFFKNQKHEPNIVEVTHMCIMHRVHIILHINDYPDSECNGYTLVFI
jgi:hypothetical protein